MPRYAVIEDATDRIIVLDPPLDDEGSPILPEGIASHAVELTPEMEQSLEADALAAKSAEEAEAAAERDAAQALRQQIVDLAQSAVGVSLSALTAAQRNALTACLLYRAGGVTDTMTVAPLNEWVT